MATNSPQTTLPTRSSTLDEQDDAIPDEDSSQATKLFHERLQAWKHACGYLEDYVTATEKMQSAHGKEYEKVLKTVNSPLKEGHHFDQNLGGIAGLFDNIRSNTQGISNSHYETAKTLKGSVLPIFERLHSEIKNKTKELNKGAGKGAKAVDKARAASQKHIELLGQHTAAHDSSAGSVKATEDPYVLHRQVYHRLNKQVVEENSNRDDMISVQNNFYQFEQHIVQTFQQGIAQFNSVLSTQCEQSRNAYGDITATSQRIPPNFEWDGFLRRNNDTLIDPSAPKRSVENIGFANQDHKATQPLIAGSLERKGGLLKSWSSGYYVITPSKYLHEFKTDDDFAKDPSPESSLYLPDCLVGAVEGVNFNVRGKDSSNSTIGNKLAMTKEYAFRAHTAGDAQKWHDVIASVSGSNAASSPATSGPTGSAVSDSKATEAGYAAPTQPAAGAAPTQQAGHADPAQQAGHVAPAQQGYAAPTQQTGVVPQAGAPLGQSGVGEKQV